MKFREFAGRDCSTRCGRILIPVRRPSSTDARARAKPCWQQISSDAMRGARLRLGGEVESRDCKDLLKMAAQLRRDPDKLVGAKLDRYEIQELIGIGGMGAVYLAQHEITKAKVAIKVLRPDLTISNEEGVGFFFEEATKTVSLQHPMIVKVLSADYTPDGSAYMVMEWLDGRTLEQEMKERGVFSLQRVIVLRSEER